MTNAIPATWRWATVGEVADVTGGLTKNAGKRDASKLRVPLVSVAAVHLRRINPDAVGEVGLLDSDGDRATLARGDLLIVEGNGSLEHIGRVALWNDEVPGARHQNHIIRVRPHDIASRFVLEWLASPEGRKAIVNEATSAAGLYTLSLSKVERLPIPVPTPSEQRRIVAKLEALQARSRRARLALDGVAPLLEKLRQSILAAAFRGDFTKDWRARSKNVEPAAELLKRIRTERRKSWEESELAKMRAKGKAPADDRWKAKYKEAQSVDATGLAELPVGWCWASVEELLVGGPTNGFSPKSDGAGSGTPTLKLSATTRGYCVLNDTTTKRTNEVIDDDESYWLSPGDLLLQRANTIEYVGVTAIFDGPDRTYIYPDLMMRLRAAPLIGARFLWRALSSAACRQFMRDHATGTAGNMPKVNGDTVRRTPVPLPPIEEQALILDLLDRADERRRALESVADASVDQVLTLERAILAKAFRGELVPRDPNEESAATLMKTATPTHDGRPAGRSKRGLSRVQADGDA